MDKDTELLEEDMVNAIKSMEERTLLKEAEEKMMSDKDVLLLIQKYQEAMDDYNFYLKSFGEKHEFTIKAQKRLADSKMEMDLHPLVKEYNDLLIKCNEPLRYIENNLISLFARRGKHTC